MQMTGWSIICQLFAIPRFFERIYRLTIRERLTLELALRESEVDAAKNYICQHSLAALVKTKIIFNSLSAEGKKSREKIFVEVHCQNPYFQLKKLSLFLLIIFPL